MKAPTYDRQCNVNRKAVIASIMGLACLSNWSSLGWCAQWLRYFRSEGWGTVEKGEKFHFSLWLKTLEQEWTLMVGENDATK